MTITVQFSCALCGVRRRRLDVPARTADQDVVAWMDATVRRVWREHARLSPLCRPAELTELLVPVTGADRIGGPAVQ